MILVILAIWLGYKKAKAVGRNPILWSFVSAVAFITAQTFSGFFIGTVMGLGIALHGWSERWFDINFGVVNVISLISGFIALWIVFRYLDYVAEQSIVDRPPPPPKFHDEQGSEGS